MTTNEIMNYNPLEEARHYKEAQKRYGYSTRDLAKKYGGQHSDYVRKLKLLELPDKVVRYLTTNEIDVWKCYHICKLVNKEKLRKKFESLFGVEYERWTEETDTKNGGTFHHFNRKPCSAYL